jgi:HAD superfamily phosphatase (TIGR01681 family)
LKNYKSQIIKYALPVKKCYQYIYVSTDKPMQKLQNLDLIIFDLDGTLINWEEHNVFVGVHYILQSLKDAGYKLAIASYNQETKQCLLDLDINDYFDYVEYDKSSYLLLHEQLKAEKTFDLNLLWQRTENMDDKRTMLENILTASKTSANKALFFDDQKRFINTAEELGIKGHLVGKDGVTVDLVNLALTEFRQPPSRCGA